MSPPSNYYDDHALEFIRDTASMNMAGLYEPFLERVPSGGRILDAGCGSGRDTRAFLSKGLDVVAIDASAKMVEAAKELTGRRVSQLRFQQIEWISDFDGIWTCASLLHVPRAEIDDVWRRLTRALKPAGVWFMSFKKGSGEAVRNGRFFNDYDEDALRALIETHAELAIFRIWTTPDVRPGRAHEQWTNALVSKK
jgi:2-polyprenyl-3-methyl-5-hydroxy-6-metoxy-1,4-benzoquinol methylase